MATIPSTTHLRTLTTHAAFSSLQYSDTLRFAFNIVQYFALINVTTNAPSIAGSDRVFISFRSSANDTFFSKAQMYADFDTLVAKIKSVSPHLAVKKDLFGYDALQRMKRIT